MTRASSDPPLRVRLGWLFMLIAVGAATGGTLSWFSERHALLVRHQEARSACNAAGGYYGARGPHERARCHRLSDPR